MSEAKPYPIPQEDEFARLQWRVAQDPDFVSVERCECHPGIGGAARFHVTYGAETEILGHWLYEAAWCQIVGAQHGAQAARMSLS